MAGLLIEQAREILLERTKKIEETEEISLWDAVGRVLAGDVVAQRNQPPFPRSPLDGYAVRSVDIAGASHENPAVLKVIDEVTAGHVCEKTVGEKMAVRIMTGAPIPPGADCVVKQEDTDYGEYEVQICEEVGAWKNYCFEGEDYKKGTVLLEAGTVLGAVEVGVLASLGMEKAEVYRRPRTALITTGDEIVLPGEELRDGKIYDSNLYTLGTRLKQWGMDVVCRERSGDSAFLVAEKIAKAAETADILITTGGVSVGKKDIMHDVLRILGCEKLFWKIAVKPGMPTLCAVYKGKLLICLSGNPFGAAVNLELLVRPVLAAMSGRKDLELQKIEAVMQNGYPKKSGVVRYVRAFYQDGCVKTADGSNASGIMSTMCGCNCLVEVPAGTEMLNEGEMVWVVLL